MWNIRRFAETDSTNDDAAALLGQPEHAGDVLVAGMQRRGRGRHDRTWIARAGTSLLCTTILPAPVATRALWAVTLWAGLAVADAIDSVTDVPVRLQWPNDVLQGGAKCAGILCVSRVAGAHAYVGCGTGINVRRPGDDAAFASVHPAPAFLSDARADVTCDAMLHALLDAYAVRLAMLDDPDAIARAWETRATLDGTPYRLLLDGSSEPIDAIARGIGNDGSLVVETAGVRREIALADARVMR